MKNKRSLLALASLAITFCVLTTGQSMAQTWTGNTDNLWDTDANWSGTPPASSGSSALTFNPANLTGLNILSTFNDLTLFTATGITFDNSTTSGAYTLAGNQITLGDNITTTGSTGTPTHTISLGMILDGNRSITTALNNNLSISGIISQDVAGRSLTKAGAGLLTLSGNNSYSGGTNIDEGTVQINTGGTLGATTGALNMGTGSVTALGTVGNLTLSTSATVGAMAVRSNTTDVTTSSNIGQLSIASGSTLTASSLTVGVSGTPADGTSVNTALSTGSTPGAGGTLTVNGNTTIGLNGPSATTIARTVVDLSGLHTFNATSTSGLLSVGSASRSRATLTLANNANTINVGTLQIGNPGGSANYIGASEMKLGAGTNKLWTTNLYIGRAKGIGQVTFAGANGSVEIAGLNGSGAVTELGLGVQTGGGTYTATQNQLLLAGHSATVNATTVNIARRTAAGLGTVVIDSLMTFDTGTFTAGTIQLATATAGGGGLKGEFIVGGDAPNSSATGVVNVSGNILLSNLSSDVTGTGILTINGGTVNVATGGNTSQGIRDNSTKTGGTGANLNSGNTTVTLQGGTLNLNGGIIGGNASGNRSIDNLNFRSGTLQNVGQINNGTTGLTKSTDSTVSGGTLTLSGANTYSGATAVNAGTLLVNGTHITSTASSGYTVAATATLGGTGRLAVNGNVSVASTGVLSPGASIGSLTLDGTNTTGDVLSMTTGSKFGFELAGNGGTPDRLDFWNYLGGDLVLNGNSIDLSLLGTQTAGTYNVDIMRFFSDGGTTLISSSHAFTSGLAIGTLGTGISSAFIDWDGTGDNNQTIALSYTVVPEPRAALLGGLGMLMLLRRRRA